ncbi:nitronate monooxygenase [Bradyrhizobium lablabi]|nr:nitronate monooxygenase family protein [Bradyrhizobium lablabi]MBR1121910.1 nitronate monooxygenase [Bradyrhizobium lablabi]
MTDHAAHAVCDLFGIEVPVVQAPMLGFVTPAMVIGVAEAGGLGSFSLVASSPEEARATFAEIRRGTSRPVNVNFFCHQPPEMNAAGVAAWMSRLEPYYAELGLDCPEPRPMPPIPAFGDIQCGLVEELKPEVVSFHFGLPAPDLLDRVRRTGAKVMSSATTVEEAMWLEESGCDAVIAQGVEAGGHRGMFLHTDIDTQVGTMALVPQVVDAVKVPVIAAGGISDPRGVAAAFALGASGVQAGSAYLLCDEANTSSLYRTALQRVCDHQTAITRIFTGRPARAIANRLVRELGPMENDAPCFPLAAGLVSPLRAASEALGASEFSPLWCGQAASLAREGPAAKLTAWLASGCPSNRGAATNA